LTWLYEYTDSLIAPIAGHSLFNATNFALLLWQTRPIHG
jgi:membrane protease YdiL (CAAX protease family)